MAIGKWSMYLCALLFLVIGLGSLAVAVVPGANEWFAEEILDASGAPSSALDDDVVDAIADSGFKSMQPRAASMFGQSVPTVQQAAAAHQPFVPRAATATGPVVEPADPTAGGIIV